MSTLQDFMRMIGSAFSSAASPPTGICTIRYPVLMKIFQLANTDIFDIEDNIPADEADLAAMASLYRDLGSPVTEHLDDTTRCRVTSRSHYARQNNDGFFTYLEYDITTNGQRLPEKWATMLLCAIEETADERIINPLFTMSGNFILHPEGYQLLIPREVMCRAKHGDEDIFVAPETPAELNGAIAYASQTMVQLLADVPFTPVTNTEWMKDTNARAASEEIDRLMMRTPQSLAADIATVQTLAGRAIQKPFAEPTVQRN